MCLKSVPPQNRLCRAASGAPWGMTPQALRGVLYFAVGITNSAPLAVVSGQRCMMDFWRV